MPCYHPIEVMIRRKALSGTRKYDNGYPQVVPCGNCIGCRAEQGRQWAVRMMHEARMHKSSVFVTLTYADEELPENGSLSPKDFQRFIKDLRKKATFSFYGCGEYGERTQRCHYHALLFGIEFLDRDIGFDSARPSVWRSEALEAIWGRGLCEGGSVTMASASYVAGYINKKVKHEQYILTNACTGELLTPEFARMSLRPAIGKRWIQKHWRDVYPRDYVVIDGVEAKPPRYYDKWMDREHPIIMDQVRSKRYDEALELTKYQLNAGEKTHQTRVHLFQRRDGI